MVISYDPHTSPSIRPPYCHCDRPHFHAHGSYWRLVAQVMVLRFLCLLCRRTISMIPTSCVPYKHHPTALINTVLDGMIRRGRSGRYYEYDEPVGIHRSTAYRWRQQFAAHSPLLATEGALRLSSAPFSGTFKTIYEKLQRHFTALGDQFFTALQVALCHQPPPLGVFRSFLF